VSDLKFIVYNYSRMFPQLSIKISSSHRPSLNRCCSTETKIFINSGVFVHN